MRCSYVHCILRAGKLDAVTLSTLGRIDGEGRWFGTDICEQTMPLRTGGRRAKISRARETSNYYSNGKPTRGQTRPRMGRPWRG